MTGSPAISRVDALVADGFAVRGGTSGCEVYGNPFGDVVLVTPGAEVVRIESRRVPVLVMLLELANGQRVTEPDAALRRDAVDRAAALLRRMGTEPKAREEAQRIAQATGREMARALALVGSGQDSNGG